MALAVKIRASVRLFLYLLATLIFLPIIILLDVLRLSSVKMRLISLYFWVAARSWGIKISQQGSFAKDRPMLVVSNHCSYTDIPVLGALAPLHFTPKLDIKSWPVIGYLCQLADCVFIDRNPRKTAENMQALNQAMQQGWMISLFPEGTTNDGHTVQQFRSSYFSLAEQGLPVQMVTVKYSQRNGQPLSPVAMRKVAWIGDDEFTPHLMEFLGQPSILATVICHEVTGVEQHENRKLLASHCYEVINTQLKKEGTP